MARGTGDRTVGRRNGAVTRPPTPTRKTALGAASMSDAVAGQGATDFGMAPAASQATGSPEYQWGYGDNGNWMTTKGGQYLMQQIPENLRGQFSGLEQYSPNDGLYGTGLPPGWDVGRYQLNNVGNYAMRDAAGNIVATSANPEHHSMTGGDYSFFASAIAPALGNIAAANGMLGAGAATGKTAIDAADMAALKGANTGIASGATGGSMAGAVGNAPTTGTLPSNAGTPSPATSPNLPTGTTPTVDPASVTSGANAAIPNVPSAAPAGMTPQNWIQLGQLGLGAAGLAAGASNSRDATRKAGEVAQSQLALQGEALDWYKQAYADQAPSRLAAEQRAQGISDAQLRGMNFATDQAKELDAYNRGTFRPLEQRMVTEAGAYDTPERRKAAAAAAAADVDMSTALARQAGERNLGRSGIAPGSAKALALQEDMNVAQGRNRGGAMTTAARNVEGQGYARMADAVGLGRGLAPTQATQQQIATTTGNSSAANAVTGLNAAQSGNQFMGQGFTTALNGMNSAGNLFNGVASNQNQQDQAMLQGISNIAGIAGNIYSDKNKKKGTGKMADGKAAVKQIDATPVHDGWSYKGDPKQTPKTGPMAQDVRASMGEAVAPGGKVIDLVSMNGRMMSAIKQLSKDVKKLQREDEREAA